MDIAATITDRLIRPLTDSTKTIFEPLQFHKHDHLSIELDKTGKRFIAKTFSLQYIVTKRTLVQQEIKGYPSYEIGTAWWNRFPERKRLNEFGQYQLAGTDFTAIIINALWPAERITFTAEAKILYTYLLQRFCHQNGAATKRAAYIVNGIESDANFIDHPELPLAPYQKIGLTGCIQQEASGLFMEQGTGKTPICIARICNEAKNHTPDSMYRVLIIAPKNVRTNWKAEFQRFATIPGKVTVLRGTALDRVKHMIEGLATDEESQWTAIITSYDTLVQSWGVISQIPWDLAVLDEAHYIKSSKSQRAKRCMELREICQSRMALTGTPVTNTIMDLYSILEWLGEGLSGFSSLKKFQEYYGSYIRRNNLDVLIGYKNTPLLQERLSRLSFSITKKDALPDLPDKLPSIYEVDMEPEQREIYKQVALRLMAECKRDLESGPKQLRVNNALVKMLRLAQITSGYVVWDGENDDDGNVITPQTIDRFDPDPKIEALIDILKQRGLCDKTIIWSCWVQNIKTIVARLKLEDIDCVAFYGKTSDKDRDIAVNRFNCDPMCSVFVGNPSAGGTGLNLLGHNIENPDDPMDCTQVIYYSQNWSMVHRSQSEDRSHRRGTRRPITYIDLVVPRTIDEEIRIRVTQYRAVAATIQDVRSIMNKILETTTGD